MKKQLKLLAFVSFAVVSLIIAGCKKDSGDKPEPEPDEYSVSYKYNEGVTVVDDSFEKYLVKVESDSILYFSSDTPSSILPEVGDIISSGVTTKLPHGLGGKVISRSEADGLYRCVTTTAPLNQIFETLKLTASFSVIDIGDLDNGFRDNNGKFYKSSVVENIPTRPIPISGDWGKECSFTLEEGSDTGLYANCTFTVGAKATVNIDLGFLHCDYDFSLDFYSGIDGEMGYKNSWSGEKELFRKDKLAEGKFTIGPVVLIPYINLVIRAEGSGEGEVSTKFSKHYSYKAGIKNGETYSETTEDGSTDLIQNLQIDGKGEIYLVCEVDFGTGLYTDNLALEIQPSVAVGFEAEFSTQNENLFRETPTLDFKVNASADIMAKLMDLIEEPKQHIGDVNIFTYSWPLLPTLVENSFTVTRKPSSSDLVFNAKYSLESGNLANLVSRLLNVQPGIRVYKGAEEQYILISDESLGGGARGFSYELTNLEPEISYTAKPCLVILRKYYDQDGIPFSSGAPAVAITDIVQTGAAQEVEHDGKKYNYAFYFYINAEIDGSENCQEWGIYDPDAEPQYSSYDLKDGRVHMSWTAWSDNSSTTFTKTPYVILKGSSERKFFEPYTHTLFYGGYFTGSTAAGAPGSEKSWDVFFAE